jgi:hypothetical protein
MSKKKTSILVVPPVKDKPAPLPFGVVSGEGVDEYDGRYKEYSVVVVLTKKQAKEFKKMAMEFWEDNAPKKAGDEPANFEKLVRKDDDGNYRVYFRTRTKFEDDDGDVHKTKIPIVDGRKNTLDPEKFGSFGEGTEGRVSFNFAIYKSKEKYGVSKWLKAVQLHKFAPLAMGGGGISAFTDDGDEVEVIKKDKKKKGKKKKGKK